MQVHRYKYLLDYRKPFSSCEPNEEWPHITLLCSNESKTELYDMKWLIEDRLTSWCFCEMYEGSSGVQNVL